MIHPAPIHQPTSPQYIHSTLPHLHTFFNTITNQPKHNTDVGTSPRCTTKGYLDVPTESGEDLKVNFWNTLRAYGQKYSATKGHPYESMVSSEVV